MRSRLFFLAVVCLLIAACSGSGADTTTTAGGETTTIPSETSTTAAADTTTTAAETTSTAGASAGGDSCVVGTWVLDDEAFIDQVFADVLEDETMGVSEVVSLEGEFATTFNANGTVEAVRSEWGFSVVTEEGTFNITINGEQAGTWEVEGSMLLLALDEGEGFDVEATAVVDGQEIELPQAPFDVPAEALSTSSEFSCDSNTLTVVSEGVTSVFNRS